MHSRFEHSLGAYHVAGQAVEILDRYQVSCMSICCHCVQTGFALCCCLLQAFRVSPIATGKKVGVHNSLVYRIYLNTRTFLYQGHELGIDRSDLRTVKLAGVKSCFLLSDLIVYSLGQTSGFNMASPPCPTLMFQFSSYFGSQNMHHASYVSSEAISIANTSFFMIGLLCALVS